MRIDVRKTPKLFINGAFARSESGRTIPVERAGELVNVARASRKDARDAVRAARAALAAWSTKTAYNRGQIIYRLAEMIESRRRAFGVAAKEIEAAIDRTVWYAGWCDKIEQHLSTKNPVAGPHFNVSSPEPTGVVAVIAPSIPALLGLVTAVIPPLAGGNAVVAIVDPNTFETAVAFSEAVATADVTPGALNILTGDRDELTPHLARHMDVNALSLWNGDRKTRREAEILAAENVKRVDNHADHSAAWLYSADAQSPQRIATFMEIKTVWHPAGV